MSRYSQKGGAIRLPYRWYNADATPFQPACQNCGLPKEPVTQEGGAIRMPNRWYNENAQAFNPACGGCGCQQCGCGKQGCGNQGCSLQNGGTRKAPKVLKGGAYDYYNDFGTPCGQGYNSSNMTYPGVEEERAVQRGGNPNGAPLYVFTQGNALPVHFPIENGPTFDRVGTNKFWASKY